MDKLFDREKFEYIRNTAAWIIQHSELFPTEKLINSNYCSQKAMAIINHDRYLIRGGVDLK